MKRLSLFAIVSAIAVLLASPAFAGSIYVPLALDRDIGPYTYTTELTVSNKGTAEDRRFKTYFIASGTDGTDRPDGSGNQSTLPAGTSNIFGLGLSQGEMGILEIDGPSQIVASARLVASDDGEEVHRIVLPVITSDTVLPSNSTAHLQGWGRDTASGLATDLGLINLSTVTASCEIDVFSSNGTELTSTVLLPLQPLSHLHFEDALALLGFDKIDLVRASVSCNQDFYIYSTRYNQQSGELAFQIPSGTGASTLGIGTPVAPGGGCAEVPTTSVCFERSGIFFTPNPGDPVRRLVFDPPSGSYSKLVLTIKVRNGGWFPSKMNGTHNIFWLVRNAKNRDMFGFVNVRGPNTNDLFIRHGFNLAQGQKPRLSSGFQHPEGVRYTYKYTFDTAQRIVDLTVTNDNGTALLNLRGTPNVNAINLGSGDNITMDIGFPLGVNPNEPPTYNWDYEDLIIEVVP